MDLTRRRTASVLGHALGAGALGWMLPAAAQDSWPSRPVKVIVPSGVGSGTDVVARVFAESLFGIFKQPFVVEVKPGANGMIGSREVARAPADGYTLLFTYAAAQVINQSLFPNAGYDGAKDFAPVAQIGSGGNFLVVAADFPARTLQEFIAEMRKRPVGSGSYGSWGVGSGGHLSMEMVLQTTGLKMQHVPYKSAAESNLEIIAGRLQAGFSAAPAAVPLIRSGKLRALAISGPARDPVLPDVPTMTEQGVPFPNAFWYALVAPAGTPRAIVDRLNAAINRTMDLPEYSKRWESLGLATMRPKSVDEFADTIRRDIATWSDVIRKSNITVD
jgi:tripartite-type tricarboxylate transporter receptor subunit TctC